MDLQGVSLWVNLAIFAGAAVAIWIAGTQLAGYADSLRKRTGLGEAVIGLVVLGVVTSLPEVATAVSSAASGNASLGVNNMLGGLAMQVAILAIVDVFVGRDALSAVVASPMVLLQGALCVLLLLLIVAGVLLGDRLVLGMGLWSWALATGYVAAVWIVAGAQGRRPWVPGDVGLDDKALAPMPDDPDDHSSSFSLAGKIAGAAVVILAAGFFLTRSGEALAEQTGLGSSYFGAVFLAFSTSLPEVSTVIAAARMRRYEMAISDIFGTNLVDAALVALVDAIHAGGAVFNYLGNFSAFAALLGIAVTTIFLIGLIERRDRTIFRLGYDAAAVLLVYFGGLVALYSLR